MYVVKMEIRLIWFSGVTLNILLGARISAYVHDHEGDALVSLDASDIGLAVDLPMYDEGNESVMHPDARP